MVKQQERDIAVDELDNQTGADVEAVAAAVSDDNLEIVYNIPVEVTAVLGRAEMQVNQLLRLGRGSVVELDRKVGETIDLFVNGRQVAKGEVVIIENRVGVTITEVIKPK
ncbi:MAG: flagellar motor switch protein FliN [Alphaproteobacteria bacterium]|nr:flagellar motor switch protein FliN [Alphaproteobacteria bacterium]